MSKPVALELKSESDDGSRGEELVYKTQTG